MKKTLAIPSATMKQQQWLSITRHVVGVVWQFLKRNKVGILILLLWLYMFWPNRKVSELSNRLDDVNGQLIELRDELNQTNQADMKAKLDELIDETDTTPPENDDPD